MWLPLEPDDYRSQFRGDVALTTEGVHVFASHKTFDISNWWQMVLFCNRSGSTVDIAQPYQK